MNNVTLTGMSDTLLATKFCMGISSIVVITNMLFATLFRYYVVNWDVLDAFPAMQWRPDWSDSEAFLEERRPWVRSNECDKNFFHVLLPFHNVPVVYFKEAINSVLLQNYPYFRVWLYDDGTTRDHPLYEWLNKFCARFANSPVIQCIRGKKQYGPGGGKYYGLLEVRTNAARNDVIAIVDGDDTLSSPNALSEINRHYASRGCWMTWGSYLVRSADQGPLPDWASKGTFRRQNLKNSSNWFFSHPRTFRAFLFDSIKPSDFQDEKHHWLMKVSDRMLVYSLLELSGVQRVCYVTRVLYSYRRNAEGQKMTSTNVDYFRKKELYNFALHQPPKVPCTTRRWEARWEMAEEALEREWLPFAEPNICGATTVFHVLVLPREGTISSVQEKVASVLTQTERARVYVFPHASDLAASQFIDRFCAKRTRKMDGELAYAVSCLDPAGLGQSKSDYRGISAIKRFAQPNDVIVVLGGHNSFNSSDVLTNLDREYHNNAYLATRVPTDNEFSTPIISFR